MEAIADAIRTNSTDGRAKGVDRSVSGSSPAVVAIMSILGTAFLLIGYYAMVAKFCGRGPTRGSLRRGWRAMGRRRIGRLHEEALEMPAGWQAAAAAHEQGLEPADIEAIPVVEFLKRVRSWKSSCSGGGAPVDCAVCLNEFEEAERVRLLPSCCHAFHLHCIDEWLRSHATCPLCRIPIHLAVAIPAPDILSSPSTTGPPTSPLLTAGSSYTSPPLIHSATTTPQHRSPPALPDEESLQISQASPLMLAEKEAQYLSKGKHKMILGCAKREEPDYSCIYHGNNMEGHPRRAQFAFTRCFSYAGDRRPFQGLFKSSSYRATTSPTTLSSSSCSATQQRQGNQYFGIMQRSSSYDIGSSLLPTIIIPPRKLLLGE